MKSFLAYLRRIDRNLNATNPLLGSTGVGVPTTSYGYIRFKATVK